MSLPKVFVNKVDRKIDNNREVFYDEESQYQRKDLEELKSYFDENGYVNRLGVTIVTKEGSKDYKLVLCKSNYFVSLSDEKIYFDDILDYSIKK